VTLAVSDGGLHALPRWMADARDRIVVSQRRRARKQKGSRAWRDANRRIAREHRKVAARSDNRPRDTARLLIARADVVALENLDLKNMTRSAKGTVEDPGSNVAAKAGLNRALQDAALGRLAMWVCVKAEEAGRRIWLVDPANTSRGCAACGHTSIDNRPARDAFCCTGCGHSAHADLNAAANIAVAARARACEAAWTAAGAPPLPRPPPRLRRRAPTTPAQRHPTNQRHRGRAGSEATPRTGASAEQRNDQPIPAQTLRLADTRRRRAGGRLAVDRPRPRFPPLCEQDARPERV